jgi:hypothetical protein
MGGRRFGSGREDGSRYGPEMTDDQLPTGAQWITAFAAALRVDPPTEHDIEVLLDLAGVAAHASERIAAPLACYLVGRAGLGADDALAEARRLADAGPQG